MAHDLAMHVWAVAPVTGFVYISELDTVLPAVEWVDHFTTKHANYASNLSTQERVATAQRLAANLKTPQNIFHRQNAIQESATKASFLVSYEIAKASKPLSEGEFVKECMVQTAGILCPENKSKFENVSLSRRTVTRRVELIDENIVSQINKSLIPLSYIH